MILEDREVWHRYFIMAMMVLVTAAGVLACALLKELDKFKWTALLFCGLLSSILVNLSIERERFLKGHLHEKANNYKRISFYYTACTVLMLPFLLLPPYYRPVYLLPALMTIVSNSVTGMICGIYFSLLLCFAGGGGAYLLAYYLLLSACGCIMIHFFDQRENLSWNCLFTGMYACCTTVLFSYLEHYAVNMKTLVTGLINGVAGAAVLLCIYYLFYSKIEHREEDILKKIIQDDYGLVQAMRSFSQIDYEHARKVSRIAKECALLVGASSEIAAAGGFYYRLGRMEGEPYVENGVTVAKANKFPLAIIRILSEYNGERNPPSTIESALIHIIDNVVTKYELLDKATLKSAWNQDIIVYQTLNEKSAQGLYDRAGFSMNMYMKVRDFLIKEVKGFDNNGGK